MILVGIRLAPFVIDEIVRAYQIRLRVELVQNTDAKRIKTVRRQPVTGKWRLRYRIDHQCADIRKISCPLHRIGNQTCTGQRLSLAQSFIGKQPEEPVSDDWTGGGSAKLVALEWRDRLIPAVEIILRIH